MLTLLIGLVIVALVLYLLNHYLPIDPRAKMIINSVVVILALVWVALNLFGVGGLDIRAELPPGVPPL